MLLKTLLFIIFLCLLTSLTFAQTTIKGKITDESGDPLPGANIYVKGTTNGTINGKYQLNVKKNDAGASFSGGTNNGSYYVSAGCNGMEGIADNLHVQAGNFRINLTKNITKKLRLDSQVSLFYCNGTFPQGNVYVPANIANPDLTWETTIQTNIGLDLGLFNNRLTATLDLYTKDTKDLLQQVALPTSTGYRKIYINRGSITNKGIDVMLNAVIIEKQDMHLSVGGNFSVNRNKIKELGIPDAPVYVNGEEQMRSYYLSDNVSTGNTFKCPANIFMADEPIGMFWGFKTDGIYQEGDTPAVKYGKQPGDVRILSLNNDGTIDKSYRTFLGDPNPDLIFGFNVAFDYKRSSLSMAWNGNKLLVSFDERNGWGQKQAPVFAETARHLQNSYDQSSCTDVISPDNHNGPVTGSGPYISAPAQEINGIDTNQCSTYFKWHYDNSALAILTMPVRILDNLTFKYTVNYEIVEGQQLMEARPEISGRPPFIP